MCGDLDEGEPSGEAALFDCLMGHALVLHENVARPAAGVDGYLDRTFLDLLDRMLGDARSGVGDVTPYRLMSLQPLVLARLAGFLAAHASLQGDPLRGVIEAVMHGYGEAETLPRPHGHRHDDDHRHGHDHVHDPDHAGHHHHH